jgi:hypothetical protein
LLLWLSRLLTIVGGGRERPVLPRHGRGKTVCARGAAQALLGGRSTSPLERHERGSDPAEAGDVYRKRLRRHRALLPNLCRGVDTQPVALLTQSGVATFASCSSLSRVSPRYVSLGSGGFDRLVPAPQVTSIRTAVVHGVLVCAAWLYRFLVYFPQANPRHSRPGIDDRRSHSWGHVLALTQTQLAKVNVWRSNSRWSGP